MMFRRSSGSSRTERAVELTKSQNMTVSWRHSADAAVVSCLGVVGLKFTSATGAVTNLVAGLLALTS
jgi:hypothetical protein